MAAARDGLIAFLDRLGIRTTTVDHPAVFTVEEARALRGAIPGGHSKNLFLKDKKDALFLVVAREDARLDLKRLHEAVGAASRLSFGKPELLLEVLGVAPGSVTPFAALNDAAGRVSVVLEAALMEAGLLNFHPLENTATTSIAAGDLLAFLRATGHEPVVKALPEAPGEL